MPEIFQFNERPDSRAWTTDPPGVTYRYKASGEHDDGIVRAYALSATPLVIFADVGTLFRGNVQIDPDGHKQYVVSVPYGPRKRETGSSTFRFDTTGATINIKAAKEHIASYPSGAPTNPHKGAIGVTKDGMPNDGLHDSPGITLNMMLTDPKSVRWEERVKAGKATINGVSIADQAKALEWGRAIVEARATRTADLIQKVIAAGAKGTGQ